MSDIAHKRLAPAKPVARSATRIILLPFFRTLTMGVLYVLLPLPAKAQLSPGALAAPHEELEGLTNCTACHEFGKGPSADKCLKCHTAVNAAINAKTGYHYRVVKTERKACFSCHSDHSGKDFQLVHWEDNMNTFNHTLTDYALSGAHNTIACRDCHKAAFLQTDFLAEHQQVNLTTTFLGLTESCLGCHRDEHRKQLGEDCTKCHTTDHWTPALGFDHNNTNFSLAGKHASAQCQQCHPPQNSAFVIAPDGRVDSVFTQFTGLPFANCTPCHTDPHNSKLGENCLKCHNQSAWSPASGFDHSSTRFPLTGKHRGAKCEQCHKNIGAKSTESATSARLSDIFASYKGLAFATCASCHKDIHKARLGPDCQGCHSTDSWRSLKRGSFDHSLTAYPLLGKHQAVKCRACHQHGVTDAETLKRSFCTDCHADMHGGQFARRKDGGACESCHSESGFTPSSFTTKRHNEESSFKLTGGHLAQPCPVCHIAQKNSRHAKARRFRYDDTTCISCHSDIHVGQFTASNPKKVCVDCHTTDSWHDLTFDHNRDASYILEGVHAQTLCRNCHKTETTRNKSTGRISFIRYRPLGSACKNCHSLKTLELLGK